MKTRLFALTIMVLLAACGGVIPTGSSTAVVSTIAPPTTTINTIVPTTAVNTAVPVNTAQGGTPNWGVQTKTSDCQASGGIQDKACTPGDIIKDATVDKICVPGYSSSVRNVPQSEKDQVYAEYGIASHTAGQYEVDHLVSLELGGSNDISNLWPELSEPRPGFHEKDKVENYLHDKVCSGALSLADAQREIATDWLSVYQNMSG